MQPDKKKNTKGRTARLARRLAERKMDNVDKAARDMVKSYAAKEKDGYWALRDEENRDKALKLLWNNKFKTRHVSAWDPFAEWFYWVKALICIKINIKPAKPQADKGIRIGEFDKYVHYSGTNIKIIKVGPGVFSNWWLDIIKQ